MTTQNTNFGRPRHLISIGDGTAITNTTTATATQTVTIPGSMLNVGDMVVIRAIGTATATNSTDTLTCTLLWGTDVIASTLADDVADDDNWYLEARVFVETTGAAATAQVHRAGRGRLDTTSSTDVITFETDDTTMQTNSDLTISHNLEWSVASTANSGLGKVLSVVIVPANG